MKIVKGLYWMETLILHLLTMERDFTPYHFETLIPDYFDPHKGSSRVNKGPVKVHRPFHQAVTVARPSHLLAGARGSNDRNFDARVGG